MPSSWGNQTCLPKHSGTGHELVGIAGPLPPRCKPSSSRLNGLRRLLRKLEAVQRRLRRSCSVLWGTSRPCARRSCLSGTESKTWRGKTRCAATSLLGQACVREDLEFRSPSCMARAQVSSNETAQLKDSMAKLAHQVAARPASAPSDMVWTCVHRHWPQCCTMQVKAAAERRKAPAHPVVQQCSKACHSGM